MPQYQRPGDQTLRMAISRPRPLWSDVRAAAAASPLVVLVAVLLPAMMTWMYGTFSATHAEWGLRGLSLLSIGSEEGGATEGLSPLYGWCVALALKIPGADSAWLLTLPSFLFAMLSLATFYLLLRGWFGTGVALLACFLLSVNETFLEETRTGGPATCALFWFLLAIFFYSKHLQTEDDVISIWPVGGAMSFAALILTVGWYALWIPFLCLFHLVYLRFDRRDEWWDAVKETVTAPTTLGGLLTVGVGLALAAPAILSIPWSSGDYAPWASPEAARPIVTGWGAIIAATPVMIVPAMFGCWYGIRECLGGGDNSGPCAFVVLWTLFSAGVFCFFSPCGYALLICLAALCVLASQAMLAFRERAVRDTVILTLAILSSWVFLLAWTGSTDDLFALFDPDILLSDRRKLELHLVIDVGVLITAGLIGVFHWTRGIERYRRLVIAAALLLLLGLASVPGVRLAGDLKRSEHPWIRVARSLESFGNVGSVVFLSSDASRIPPQLRFLVRELFPGAATSVAVNRREMERLVRLQDAKLLVLVTSDTQRLPLTVPISKGAGAITLTKVFDSEYASAYTPVTGITAK